MTTIPAEVTRYYQLSQKGGLGAILEAKKQQLTALEGIHPFKRGKLRREIGALEAKYNEAVVDDPDTTPVLTPPSVASRLRIRQSEISDTQREADRLANEAAGRHNEAVMELKRELDKVVPVKYEGLKANSLHPDFNSFLLTLQSSVADRLVGLESMFVSSERADKDAYKSPKIVVTRSEAGTMSATLIAGVYGDIHVTKTSANVTPLKRDNDLAAYDLVVKSFNWESEEDLKRRGRSARGMDGMSMISTVNTDGIVKSVLHERGGLETIFSDGPTNSFLSDALDDALRVVALKSGGKRSDKVAGVIFVPVSAGRTIADYSERLRSAYYESEGSSTDSTHNTVVKVLGNKSMIAPYTTPGNSFTISY